MRKRHIAVSAALSISFAALSPLAAHAAGNVPGTPTNLVTFPNPVTATGAAQPCGTAVAFAGLENIGGSPGVYLSADLNSGTDNAGGYSAEFDVVDNTTGTALAPIDSAGEGENGSPVSVEAPVVDGHSYSWTVRETDGTSWSSPAGPCDFVSDTTAPLGPTVTSTDFPTSGGGLQSGEPGSFTLTSSDPAPATGTASGLKGFSYSFDTPLSVGGPVTAANANGSLTLSNESFGWGTHTLYVQAVDNADNVSGQMQYSFYVAQSPELSPQLTLTNTGALSVAADGSASTGLWAIASCAFDFGDHTPVVTSSTCKTPHTYTAPGNYPVTMTVSDIYNNQKSVTENFTATGLAAGTLVHDIRLANGSWQSGGWGTPAGSTGIAQTAITALPNGSGEIVAVTTGGALEYDTRYASPASWSGWTTVSQPGVTVTSVGIAGMRDGSAQFTEVTSTGVLKHDIRLANGSWQSGGWGTPAGSTGIAQAAITALPNGSGEIVAVTTGGALEYDTRYASPASWSGWSTVSQPGAPITTVANADAAGMPDGSTQFVALSGS